MITCMFSSKKAISYHKHDSLIYTSWYRLSTAKELFQNINNLSIYDAFVEAVLLS